MIDNNAETHVLQHAFRNIMNAFARPGRLGVVEAFGRADDELENPLSAHFEVVVRTLVDQAVTFAVSGMRHSEATQWVTLKTHSHPTELEQADFILIPDVANSLACRDAILKAFEGTLIAPEKGATVVVGCGALAGNYIPGNKAITQAVTAMDSIAETAAGAASVQVAETAGTAVLAQSFDVEPGDKTYCVTVSGPGIKNTHTFFVDRIDWLEARRDRGDEYPCGIDLILVDVDGHIVGIPRTTKIVSVEKEGAAWDM